ncbi:nucleoside deaminase [Cytophagaceae bacterium ABcell3]|nr:nucleoside deaminase [Cytophagaceae bacterium ABcell3]
MLKEEKEKWLKEAIKLSVQGVKKHKGGPFGAVVVKNGQIIGKGFNQVTSSNDPTAHAEIIAIREACKYLDSFQLDGCEIYTSCEPCPMCLGAIYWARPKAIYYACTRETAAEAGFDDSLIYDEINKSAENRKIPMKKIDLPNDQEPFDEWKKKADKTEY